LSGNNVPFASTEEHMFYGTFPGRILGFVWTHFKNLKTSAKHAFIYSKSCRNEKECFYLISIGFFSFFLGFEKWTMLKFRAFEFCIFFGFF
jgi:hypothetical protein